MAKPSRKDLHHLVVELKMQILSERADHLRVIATLQGQLLQAQAHCFGLDRELLQTRRQLDEQRRYTAAPAPPPVAEG